MNIIESIETLYSNLKFRDKNKFLERIRFYAAARYLTRRFANWWFPIYFCLTRRNSNYKLVTTARTQKIIVSLTSFPKRIDTLWMVIETMLRQSVKPDMIILWLSKNQFQGIDSLPKSLTGLCDRGLTIRFVEGDIRSHKKYYYTLMEYTNDILITIDDDIFYSPLLIEKLINGSRKYPGSIMAKYAYKIKWEADGQVCNYKQWEKISQPCEPSFDYFFGTGGGTIFPPGTLYEDITNIDLALKLCPLADDVYVNSMARVAGSKIGVIDQNFTFIPFLIENNETLADTNFTLDENDVQIKAVKDYYQQQKNINIYQKQWKG